MEVSLGLALVGLISFVSPCVLALVPVYLAYLGETAAGVAAVPAGGAAPLSLSAVGRLPSSTTAGRHPRGGTPPILGWQARFSHLCVDEFQDVDAAQLRLVQLLAAPEDNLFVVGDDDQP